MVACIVCMCCYAIRWHRTTPCVESVKVLNALNKGDMSMIPANGVINISARVIKKDNAEAFWKELKARIKAGKEAGEKK